MDALISLQDINTETGEKNKYEDIPVRAGSVQMDAAYEYCKNFFSNQIAQFFQGTDEITLGPKLTCFSTK